MRTNLITHFYCNTCGHQLNVDYSYDDSPKKVKSAVQTEKEPTGAACRYNDIFVVPCSHCIDEKLAPAKKLVEAIAELTK